MTGLKLCQLKKNIINYHSYKLKVHVSTAAFFPKHSNIRNNAMK